MVASSDTDEEMRVSRLSTTVGEFGAQESATAELQMRDLSKRRPTQPLRGREPLGAALDRAFQLDRTGTANLPRQRERRSPWTWLVLFLALLAGGAGTVYFGFVATGRYVTEIHLTVRSSNLGIQADAASTAIFGLSNTTGAAYSDSFLVSEYLRSAAVVADVSKKVDLRAMFSRDDIDFIGRFDPKGTADDLVKYWQKRVLVDYDPMTATVVMQVQAFTPLDALTIANMARSAADDLINKMDMQARGDILQFATNDLDRSKKVLRGIEIKLAHPGDLNMVDAQNLRVERDFAQKDYENALTQMLTAKSIIERTQRYIVAFVHPQLPSMPTAPIRWQAILVTWLAVIMVTSVIVLFTATIREHIL